VLNVLNMLNSLSWREASASGAYYPQCDYSDYSDSLMEVIHHIQDRGIAAAGNVSDGLHCRCHGQCQVSAIDPGSPKCPMSGQQWFWAGSAHISRRAVKDACAVSQHVRDMHDALQTGARSGMRGRLVARSTPAALPRCPQPVVTLWFQNGGFARGSCGSGTRPIGRGGGNVEGFGWGRQSVRVGPRL
jgi:hypothetical protein